MKGIQISKLCSENWNKMTPNQKGKFCQKCSKSVYDFTRRSNEEIKSILLKFKGQEVCGKILTTQESSLNSEFDAWELNNRATLNRAMLFSLVVVFGLSVLSCTTAQEKIAVQEFQEKAIVVLSQEPVLEDEIEKGKVTTVIQVVPVIEIEKPEATRKIISVRRTLSGGYEEPLTREGALNLAIVDYDRIEIMGRMVSHLRYEEYLEDTIPEPITEYDDLGRILPTESSATSFPNPTRLISTIKLEISEKTTMRIILFNLHGELVTEIANKDFERGTFELPVDLSEEKAGMYLIAISSKEFSETIRVVKQ
ncbi:MAG TPA: T9SS type A sorting domain-containing protein [Crocinitomicaceae bacterium]|nr:T9SS type A sorting domain-containing protein [Crocinitomicaceae bacterium]